jgi:hypothetical protein
MSDNTSLNVDDDDDDSSSGMIYYGLAAIVWVVGVVIGIVAYNKAQASGGFFGDNRWLHIVFGFFLPFFEIIFGSIEIHKSK